MVHIDYVDIVGVLLFNTADGMKAEICDGVYVDKDNIYLSPVNQSGFFIAKIIEAFTRIHHAA